MKKVKMYLAHPFETIGNPEENIIEEAKIAKRLKTEYPFFELVRPLKVIPIDFARDRALSLCKDLLKTCDGIIMTGRWFENMESACWMELREMVKREKPVYEYTDKTLRRIV